MPTLRQHVIAQFVRDHRWATVQELTTLTGSSEATIRRDLHTLAKRGELVRVHGGATRRASLADVVTMPLSPAQMPCGNAHNDPSHQPADPLAHLTEVRGPR